THLSADGLDVIRGALKKIRDSVKYVKGSETRKNLFRSCMETVGIQSEAGLIIDVSTRWNSTFLMLSRAILFKDVLRNLVEVDKSYMKSICNLLKPFAEITKMISGSSYPTSNMYFMPVWAIKCWLRDHEDSSDMIICEIVEDMNEKFNKYWEEFNDILAIAAVLDPRLTFVFLEYCYNTLDPLTSKSNVAHIRSKMAKLFRAYKTIQGTLPQPLHKFLEKTFLLDMIKIIFLLDCSLLEWVLFLYFSKSGVNGKSPQDIYLDEQPLDIVSFRILNVIAYWKDNASRFKELASMACDVLSIPITTVASESSFFIGSRVLNKYSSCLSPINVQALICARNWFRVGLESPTRTLERQNPADRLPI
ncbi:hypothetical protein CARUB_v10016411mg, partial [Capsella rubella]